MDILAALPYEVAVDVLAAGVLHPPDLARLACVSPRYRALVADDAVWCALARRWRLCPPSLDQDDLRLDESLADALAFRPPLVHPPPRPPAHSPAPIRSWRTFVTLHHLSSAAFGTALDGTPLAAPQPSPASIPLGGQLAGAQGMDISHFRHLGNGLIAATGVNGGLLVQNEEGKPNDPPLWILPTDIVPPNSRIEVGDGLMVVLPPTAEGPTDLQVFKPCPHRRGHQLRCPTLRSPLAVAHIALRQTTLVAIDAAGSAAHIFHLNGGGETLIDLGHCRLQTVTALDLDLGVEGRASILVAGTVRWGAPGCFGVPYLGGSDVLAIDIATGTLLWSLTQGPFPLDQLRRDQMGWARISASPAVLPEYFTLAFPSWSTGEGPAQTTMHSGQLEQRETFHGDPGVSLPCKSIHWSFYLRLQYRRAWTNVQFDTATDTLLVSSGATLVLVRDWGRYVAHLASFCLPPSLAQPTPTPTQPAVRYIELPEPPAQPYDMYGRAGPYVPSGYGERDAGWRTHWARTRLSAHDGWALWDGQAPILLGYGAGQYEMQHIKVALLCPDASCPNEARGALPALPAPCTACPALERAVEQRACTVMTPGSLAAYRLRPLHLAEEQYHFCLQRWTLADQARTFLNSTLSSCTMLEEHDGGHTGAQTKPPPALAPLTNRPHLIHPRRHRVAITLAV